MASLHRVPICSVLVDVYELPTTITFQALAGGIAEFGLVGESELAQVVAEVGGNPQRLAAALVEKSLLTEFQLTELAEGRGAGLRVGNYDILDRLGAGGMGTVFKARHRRMKRIVALKVLAASLSKNPLFVKRFQREVETIACLGHPNVVMAYDADEADAGHFLVMEFVNGMDLAGHVERTGPFPLHRAVDCTLQAARGLAYAHSQGIIHRDIKPHNLLCDHNGVVKVTDLGLARLNHGADGPAEGSDVTMAGGVIGTADYMPPEQAFDSTTIDHRADIYSLGCTLHYLIAGQPPFGGPTLMAILLKHRDGEIPKLSDVLPETPASLDKLFRGMLAKRPEQRIGEMSAVVAELEGIARTLSPSDGTAAQAPATGSAAGAVTAALASNSTKEMFGATVEFDTRVEQAATVLIVEPSRVQASIIRSLLQEQSIAVADAVTCGKDAIEAARTLRPRAIISAMHLKDMDGIELAQQIRANSKTGAPGFVLITSESDDETASLSHINRVLTLKKPFTAAQLGEALNLVMGASSSIEFSQRLSGFGAASNPRDRSRKKVLIVDDSMTARMNAKKTLLALGFSDFVEVNDGAYAIGAADRESCDLIVTDYNMPLMDGRALVSYLKQNPATASIPILMVTTETEPKILDPVRRLGVVAIVEKAFPVSVVGPLMDSLFGANDSSGQARPKEE